jgi:hypothetical protein
MNANDLTTPPDPKTAHSSSSSSRASARTPLASRALVALALAGVWGCTITTTSNTPDGGGGVPPPGDDARDGGGTTPTPEAGTSPDTGAAGGDATVGVLGFTPSNGIASVLAGIDVSMLNDIDVQSAQEQLGVDCNAAGTGGCVSKTLVQPDGSSIEVYVAKSWKIEPTGVLTVADRTPVVIVAIGTIDVLGKLNVNATGSQTVAGGFVQAAGGPGQGGPSVTRVANVDTGIAAGGGAYCGVGGAAGKATATNGGAGKTYGTAAIVPLVGGSAGGVGSLTAGAGGGAVQLVAGMSITIASGGTVSAGGGAGYDGSSDGAYAASGGGSGGAVLIEAPTVTIAGNVGANGGGGGGGATGTMDAHDATASATPAPGGQPGTTGAGGSGSAGATVTGTAGGVGDALNGNFSPGAGGGGAGYIRVNTTTGSATLGGTISPAPGSTCMSQGSLAH